MFHEVPDGGMVGFRADRELCYQLPHVWGAATEEHLPAEGWTPLIEWYDDRDLGKAETGILYLSETALTARNGRLRIVEPFRLTIPEHPPGDALIAEAARQASERDFWRGSEVPEVKRAALYENGRMPVMLRISEDEWRRPERALRSTGRMRALHWSEAALEAFGALARHLEPHLGPAGFVSLPGSAALEVEDPGAAKVLRSLARGRIFGLVDIRRHGVPMQFGRRQALMVRGPEAERFDKDLGSRLRFDDYVPFTCVGGIVTPDPANSGLAYWFRDRCTDRDHFEGFDFFGGPVEGMTFPYPMNDALILDRRSGDLWWVRTST